MNGIVAPAEIASRPPIAATPLGRVRPGRWVEAVVFAVAVAARIAPIARYGALHGDYGYDAGVYFSAADAFTHGRLPYRDFTLLHPPGLMLFLSPFTLLTRLMSDQWAFTVTTFGIVAVSALNAVLVVWVGRRLGFGPFAAAAGGVFYAVWLGAAGTEFVIKLEPVSNLALLVALLALLRAHDGRRLRYSLLAGFALTALVSVKIWWIVPAGLLVGWHVLRMRERRVVGALAAGVAVAALAIDAPFFAFAPRAMWSMVVADQIGRTPFASSVERAVTVSSIPGVTDHLSVGAQYAITAGLAVIGVALVAQAWRWRAARFAVVLLVAQVVVLFVAPSFFRYYTDYLAVALALVLAATIAAPRRGWVRRTPRVGLLIVAGAAAITAITYARGAIAVPPDPGMTRLAAAVRHERCVMSDTNMTLIQLNVLTRDLRDGCPNWVDVTGRTYGPFRSDGARVDNQPWQRALRRYLRAGGAVILGRAPYTGLDARTSADVRAGGVLAKAGPQIVYRVPRN